MGVVRRVDAGRVLAGHPSLVFQLYVCPSRVGFLKLQLSPANGSPFPASSLLRKNKKYRMDFPSASICRHCHSTYSSWPQLQSLASLLTPSIRTGKVLSQRCQHQPAGYHSQGMRLVNFRYHLDVLSDSQIVVQKLFLGVYEGVSIIAFDSADWLEKICSHQHGWASSNLLRA